jgi:hypothetical protein
MPDINSLGGRIDAAFSAAAEKIKKFQAENVAKVRFPSFAAGATLEGTARTTTFSPRRLAASLPN